MMKLQIMNKVRFILAFFPMLLFAQELDAQTLEAGTSWDMLNMIRIERFDFILPQTMRDNNIDMWIHVIREGSDDPLRLDLGANSGWFIFTDRGSDRIERAVFGSLLGKVQNSGVYDIIKTPAPEIETGLLVERRQFIDEEEIRQFVTGRDPKRIAVNFSEELGVYDTISHTDYLKLVKSLGDKYAKRMVSADHLIIDFCSRKVMSEIVLYGQLCKISAEIIERAFDTIKPGVTTLEDVAVWLRDNKIALEYGCNANRSLGNVFLRDPDGNERLRDDHVIQGGDLIGIVHGVRMMNYASHISGIAYVLREGETTRPPEIQKIFDHVLKTREIFRKNIKMGLTVGETLEILKRKLEEAGYVYIDADHYDRNADPKKTQVFMGMHTLGRGMLDPWISPLGPDRARNIKIPLYHTFAFEYMIHMPVLEWGSGKHLYVCLHDGVIVTERGIEFPYPPIQRIRLIH